MNIYVDIDHTICNGVDDGDYSKATPIEKNIERVNQLYDEGHKITYWTARGSVTGKDWFEVTRDQLDQWGCKRHGLKMGKPAFDIFIDDKVLNTAVWEKKGNQVLNRVFLQNQKNYPGSEYEFLQGQNNYPGSEYVALKPDPPINVGKIGEVIFKKKDFWAFEGDFEKGKMPESLINVDARPTLNIKETLLEDGSYKLDESNWEKITITYPDLSEEQLANWADIMGGIFSEKPEWPVGNGNLKLYDGTRTLLEEWKLNNMKLIEANFGDFDHYNDCISLNLKFEYESVEYLHYNEGSK